MSFAGDIVRFGNLSLDRIDKTVQDSAVSAGIAVIAHTPVGDPSSWSRPAPPGYKPGRLRGNWYASLDNPTSKHEKSRLDPTGYDTWKNVEEVARTADGDAEIYITNNTPYAARIEYGYSKQAPVGMLRTNTTASKLRHYKNKALATAKASIK